MNISVHLLGVTLLSSILIACSGKQENKPPEVPRFADAELQQGRSVWMQVCRNCHLMGVSGAPPINNYPAWEPRLAKGKDALYQSALNGIRKDNDWTMPPRGGKASLTDEQVKRAVDFKMAVVKELHAQSLKK